MGGDPALAALYQRGDQKAKTNTNPRQWYLLTWLGGLLIAGAPRFGLWLRTPTLLTDHFQGALKPDLWATLLAFTVRANGANPLTYPFLDSILAPLLLLAIGALLFNLDRLPGLLLLLWLGGGLLFEQQLDRARTGMVHLVAPHAGDCAGSCFYAGSGPDYDGSNPGRMGKPGRYVSCSWCRRLGTHVQLGHLLSNG